METNQGITLNLVHISTDCESNNVKFDHAAHKDLWIWLSNHPGNMCRFSEVTNRTTQGVWDERYFACRYAQRNVEDPNTCQRCPFQISHKLDKWGRIPCFGGFYYEWSYYTTIIRRLEDNPLNPRSTCGVNLESAKRLCRMYARSIANLPIKENHESSEK